MVGCFVVCWGLRTNLYGVNSGIWEEGVIEVYQFLIFSLFNGVYLCGRPFTFVNVLFSDSQILQRRIAVCDFI